jgi:hypothetical protein
VHSYLGDSITAQAEIGQAYFSLAHHWDAAIAPAERLLP